VVPSTATAPTLVSDAELLEAYRGTTWTVEMTAGTLGDVRPLLVELGLVFGQNAVVWIDATGAASLVNTRAGFAGMRPGQKIDL
jgi:hypothetical protein